jgi:hypothetical protein
LVSDLMEVAAEVKSAMTGGAQAIEDGAFDLAIIQAGERSLRPPEVCEYFFGREAPSSAVMDLVSLVERMAPGRNNGRLRVSRYGPRSPCQ